jgi:hypothetical protein
LCFGDRQQRPVRLNEPDEIEIRNVWVRDTPVQARVSRAGLLGQEVKRQIKSGGVDDHIGVRRRVIGKAHLPPVDSRYRRSDIHPPAPDRASKAVRDRDDVVTTPTTRVGDAVAMQPTGRDPAERGDHLAAHAPRNDARHPGSGVRYAALCSC